MSTTEDKITTWKKQLEAMLAFHQGMTIQYLNKTTGQTKWAVTDDPVWDWDVCDYRIKPEPKIIYLNEYDGDNVVHSSEVAALSAATPSCPRKAVRYIEVIEEG